MRMMLLLAAVLVSSSSTGCAFRRTTGAEGDRPVVAVSLADVQDMLSTETRCEDVRRRLGQPLVQPQGNWGNLMYALPDGKYLFFFFKGPYVTGARYDTTEIQGIAPKTHEMEFAFDLEAEKWLVKLDKRSFKDLLSFKQYLVSLPGEPIVEWQQDDSLFSGQPSPLSTAAEIAAFKTFCREQGIVLIHYPGG